jgi:hypothetical protein
MWDNVDLAMEVASCLYHHHHLVIVPCLRQALSGQNAKSLEIFCFGDTEDRNDWPHPRPVDDLSVFSLAV